MSVTTAVVAETRRRCDVCKTRLPRGCRAIPFGWSVMHGRLYFCSVKCMNAYNRVERKP